MEPIEKTDGLRATEAPPEAAQAPVEAAQEPQTPEAPNEETAEDDLLSRLGALRESYPELDPVQLAQDPLFITFAAGKGGDLRKIYEDFGGFLARAEERVQDRLRRREELDRRSTAAAGAAPSDGCGLSAGRLSLLRDWNREYPEYAMSPREYAAACGGPES